MFFSFLVYSTLHLNPSNPSMLQLSLSCWWWIQYYECLPVYSIHPALPSISFLPHTRSFFAFRQMASASWERSIRLTSNWWIIHFVAATIYAMTTNERTGCRDQFFCVNNRIQSSARIHCQTDLLVFIRDEWHPADIWQWGDSLGKYPTTTGLSRIWTQKLEVCSGMP